ncbi:uncharacterized protein LOC143251825 isoform X2 [Tachypleus tridentatus]|uniref:uncharacterized protein LOC143251825 isoform X2 n=1 Tax=Tachypleus tridentatus TaxID=6853 RepID=UPI003FD25D45
MGSLDLLSVKIKRPGGRLGNLRIVKLAIAAVRLLLFVSTVALIKVGVLLFPSLRKTLANNTKVIYKKTDISQEGIFKYTTSSNIS